MKHFYTWDIETENWTDIIAIGYYSPDESGIVSTPGDMLDIMEAKGGSWFAHASGLFDNKFLLEDILTRYAGYDIDIKLIQNTIGHIQIKQGRETLFTLRDSYYLLPQSLAHLAKAFEVGEKMDMDRGEMSKYSQAQVREYVLSDCILLHNILTEAQNHGFNIDNITLAQNAFNQWKKIIGNRNFQNVQINANFDETLRSAYFGGRTEVFNRRGSNLNYYDVHSMYPYVMSHYEYPLGKPLFTKHYQPKKLGIYHCQVIIPNGVHIPPVPYRAEDGKILFPTGKFYTDITTPEIELVRDIGGQVNVIEGYYWEYTGNFFRDYIKKWYSIKEENTGALYTLAKLYLNSLYGKMAQRRTFQSITTEMPPSKAEMIEGNYSLIWYEGIENELQKPDGTTLVTLSPELLQLWSYEVESMKPYTLLHLGLYITAYARITLFKYMQQAQQRGTVFYCDTDSIITDATLPTHNELGGLGLETPEPIQDGIFLAPKLYAYKLQSGKEKVVAKGCNVAQLTFSDFEKVFEGQGVIRSEKDGLMGFLEALKRKQPFVTVRILERTVDGKFTKRELVNETQTNPLKLLQI